MNEGGSKKKDSAGTSKSSEKVKSKSKDLFSSMLSVDNQPNDKRDSDRNARSGSSPSLKDYSSLLSDIISHIDSKLLPITRELDDLNKLAGFINAKFDEIMPELKKVKDDLLDSKKQIATLVAENNDIKQELSFVKKALAETQAELFSTCLEIRGLKVTKDSDLQTIIKKTASTVCDGSLMEGIKDVSVRQNRSGIPSVIITFDVKSQRDRWLSAIRARKGLRANEILDEAPNLPVYFNEVLPGSTRRILLWRKRRKRLMVGVRFG